MAEMTVGDLRLKLASCAQKNYGKVGMKRARGGGVSGRIGNGGGLAPLVKLVGAAAGKVIWDAAHGTETAATSKTGSKSKSNST
eukprot:CAMPEP_0171744482 /NCGR_PEP_ID=MMETSP0991-20121206/37533_1 /TAXON_ID=483369 /ORGANISM="non described non described, Strain CCMP2098" /LENGTH=83 /DNA_ID=CAMNT_0012343655 /DNA_START=9 /DNA_END=256 /DNA_ORIENTATION=+